MHASKCVKENFGFIGCSTDVLELVDAQCSGRRECSMRILDENFGNAKPCHDDRPRDPVESHWEPNTAARLA